MVDLINIFLCIGVKSDYLQRLVYSDSGFGFINPEVFNYLVSLPSENFQ